MLFICLPGIFCIHACSPIYYIYSILSFFYRYCNKIEVLKCDIFLQNWNLLFYNKEYSFNMKEKTENNKKIWTADKAAHNMEKKMKKYNILWRKKTQCTYHTSMRAGALTPIPVWHNLSFTIEPEKNSSYTLRGNKKCRKT